MKNEIKSKYFLNKFVGIKKHTEILFDYIKRFK